MCSKAGGLVFVALPGRGGGIDAYFYSRAETIFKDKVRTDHAAFGSAFAVALAYFPISFESYIYTDEDGQEVTVEGLEAIRMQRENQGQFHGEITEEKLAESIDRWHSFENRYEGGLPDGIYDDRVSGSDYFQDVYPYEWILTRMSEAYAEPETGMALSREELTEEHADGFYQQIDRHLSDLLYLENGTGKKVDAAVSQAKTLYEQIDRPFYYESGISSNAVDYTVLIVFLLVILGTILIAPAFSSDYQTQAEQIIKCTRHGRRKLAVNRILAALLIVTVEYFLCTGIFLLIMDTAFGWESLKTSVQALLSVAVFLPVNIWELQILIILGGYISLLATICFTLFLSGRMKKYFLHPSWLWCFFSFRFCSISWQMEMWETGCAVFFLPPEWDLITA